MLALCQADLNISLLMNDRVELGLSRAGGDYISHTPLKPNFRPFAEHQIEQNGHEKLAQTHEALRLTPVSKC